MVRLYLLLVAHALSCLIQCSCLFVVLPTTHANYFINMQRDNTTEACQVFAVRMLCQLACDRTTGTLSSSCTVVVAAQTAAAACSAHDCDDHLSNGFPISSRRAKSEKVLKRDCTAKVSPAALWTAVASCFAVVGPARCALLHMLHCSAVWLSFARELNVSVMLVTATISLNMIE